MIHRMGTHAVECLRFLEDGYSKIGFNLFLSWLGVSVWAPALAFMLWMGGRLGVFLAVLWLVGQTVLVLGFVIGWTHFHGTFRPEDVEV